MSTCALTSATARASAFAAMDADSLAAEVVRSTADLSLLIAPRDFRRFLCVEAALIEKPVHLAAGEQWWGRQTLIAG